MRYLGSGRVFATEILICMICNLGVSPVMAFQSSSQRFPRTSTAVRSVSSTSSTSAAAIQSVTWQNMPKDMEPDLLCDFLLEVGACAAYVVDADRGTIREEAIFAEPTNNAWQDSLQWAAPVWNRCDVTAHFGSSVDVENLVDMVQETFLEEPITVAFDSVPHDRDWVQDVQKQWPPLLIEKANILLKFPWHNSTDIQAVLDDQAEPLDANKPPVELQLQGGIAFGTGEHATTQLCLRWLDQTLETMSADSELTVLDYGAGSGVLGMAACQMGRQRYQKSIRAVGVDIDVDACRIANTNAIDNGVPMKTYLPPPSNDAQDSESRALLLKAHEYARQQVQDQTEQDDWFLPDDSLEYDILVANILAAPLMTLAPVFYQHLRPGGALGLSGILAHQGEDVRSRFQEVGFVNVQVEREQDGWVLVTASRDEELD